MDYLRGTFTAPWLVGLARAAAEAAAFVVLYTVADFIAAGGLPDELGIFGPIALVLVRPIEGVLDQIDANRSRARSGVDADFDTTDGDEDESPF